jgi:hypothetical protein
VGQTTQLFCELKYSIGNSAQKPPRHNTFTMLRKHGDKLLKDARRVREEAFEDLEVRWRKQQDNDMRTEQTVFVCPCLAADLTSSE